jgi:type IV pilus assembly protein PilC
MKFTYKSKTIDNKIESGEIEAANLDAASEVLRKQNLFITSISSEEKEIKGLNFLDKYLNRISLKDKILFTEQLAVMLQSGYPLVPALSTLEKQTQNKNLAKIIGEISEEVKSGIALSECFKKRPDVFPNIYAQLTKSGEKSGKLDTVLNKLSEDLTKNFDLNSKIRGALIYPAFILVSLVAVIIIIVIFVMPQLQTLFSQVGASLPLSTRILLSLSSGLINYWWLIIIIIVGLIFFYFWIKKIPSVRSFIDTVKLKIPVFGQLQKKAYFARFTRTLSALSSAGLPILDTFETLIDITDNVHFKKDLRDAAKKIEAGVPVGESLKESKNFSPLVYDMITVGEKAGNLEFVLDKLTRFLDKDVTNMSKNLTTLIEPVLMIIMGAGVAFVLISVLGPIYGLVQVIK